MRTSVPSKGRPTAPSVKPFSDLAVQRRQAGYEKADTTTEHLVHLAEHQAVKRQVPQAHQRTWILT